MGLKRGMLHALGGEGALIGDSGGCERGRDVPIFAMHFGHDIARRVRDAMPWRLVGVDHRCAR